MQRPAPSDHEIDIRRIRLVPGEAPWRDRSRQECWLAPPAAHEAPRHGARFCDRPRGGPALTLGRNFAPWPEVPTCVTPSARPCSLSCSPAVVRHLRWMSTPEGAAARRAPAEAPAREGKV